MGHPLAGLTVVKRFPIANVFSYTVKKDHSLTVYVDDIKIGWKETKHYSDVESTQQRS